MQRRGFLTGDGHISLYTALATSTAQQRQELLDAAVAQPQHVKHHPDPNQPTTTPTAWSDPPRPQRPGGAAPRALHATLGDGPHLRGADRPVLNCGVNPPIVAVTMETTSLKLEYPVDRW
ncbi:MAG: hypothetical protein HQ546_11435 [Planctomycetes bacterium]|nr:hypothetical protein [Planctomycetota bacterium]